MSEGSPQLKTLEAMASVLRSYETQGGDPSLDWDELLAEDCVYVDWSLEPLHGKTAIRESVLEPYATSFAEQSHEISEVVSDGSRMVIMGEFSGRFVNEYAGIEPTGESVSWQVRDVWTFDAGQVVRIDIGGDTLSSSVALGLSAGGE